MSRGLGWLQREILDALELAPAAGRWPGDRPDGVYDLRKLVKHLSQKHGKGYPGGGRAAWVDWYVDPTFTASFSRAVRGLVRRGELVRHDRGAPQTRFVGRPGRDH